MTAQPSALMNLTTADADRKSIAVDTGDWP